MKQQALLDRLAATTRLEAPELTALLTDYDEEDMAYAAQLGGAVSRRHFGTKIYTRGLIELTNYCKNDCYYCGIRCGNRELSRYRLSHEQIMDCCAVGYQLGFRTFVLQGGEDPHYTDELLVEIVSDIRRTYPDCAITLSLGERSRQSYQQLFNAGANRYLLRHETATKEHYQQLHPPQMSFDERMRCLRDLKEIGFQTGCGNMIGAPFQTVDHLVKDLLFMAEFQPQMIGMGPFIPHHATPFAHYPAGTAELSVYLLSLVRLMHPKALIPATTALGTVRGDGRQLGVRAGANVIMPNLSPLDVRKDYLLYDGKTGVSDDAAESIDSLRRTMAEIGYQVVTERGDYTE